MLIVFIEKSLYRLFGIALQIRPVRIKLNELAITQLCLCVDT